MYIANLGTPITFNWEYTLQSPYVHKINQMDLYSSGSDDFLLAIACAQSANTDIVVIFMDMVDYETAGTNDAWTVTMTSKTWRAVGLTMYTGGVYYYVIFYGASGTTSTVYVGVGDRSVPDFTLYSIDTVSSTDTSTILTSAIVNS
jgi:hypothetical protein